MKCTYCSTEIKKGTGLMYVHRIGDTAFYCSNACFKNGVVMRRKPNRKLVSGPAVAKAVKPTVEKMAEKKEEKKEEKKQEKPAQTATSAKK